MLTNILAVSVVLLVVCGGMAGAGLLLLGIVHILDHFSDR